MKRIAILALAIALILSACNMPQPTPDAVATIVAATLTSAAPVTAVPNINNLIGATATPLPLPSQTAAQPGPTQVVQTQVVLVTATPLPSTPVPTGDEPALRSARPNFIEGFENPNSGWNYEDDQFLLKPENGVLNLRSKGTPWWNSWFSTRPFFQDGYVEVKFRLSSCQGDDRVGLVLRLTDNNFYFMGLSCRGSWGFDRYSSANQLTNIRAYEASTALGPVDQWNRLGVLAEGDHFSFYINGVYVGDAQDGTYVQEGRFGFISRAYSATPFLTEADDLGYWALP